LDSEGKVEDLRDARWTEEEYRSKNIDHVIDVLGQWTKTHTVDELFNLGQLMRFPWAPIQSPNEILANPHLKARRFFIGLEHPELGSILKYPGLPYKFSSRHSMHHKKAPRVAEDNVRVYQKDLGLSNRELEALSHKGVI
jgi:crotonobetainyl-CoA:carnitine CoA-transferase CaiB-like acyl-CoA transferase